MHMNKVFLDVTTKNCLFNSIEPQGSYLFHRFGKRVIPEEHLDIDLITTYIDEENIQQIILESVFGDPLEYKYIEELFKYCKENTIDIVIVCNGYSDNLKLLEEYNAYVLFKIYGLNKSFDIIMPGYNPYTLINNLKYCDKIIYHLYEQNLCDVEHVYKTGKEIEFVKGPLVHSNINHIFTSDGEWLYDINGLDNLDIKNLDYESLLPFKNIKINLNKTMKGYHLLKNYVMPIKGQSILDTNVYNIEYKDDYSKQISISYKGHIFNTIEERNAVSNAYIPDWRVDLFGTNIGYHNSILSMLSKFANNKKISI
jgi:hypothetical protein